MERVKDVLRIVVDRERDFLANAIVDHRFREIEIRVGHMLEIKDIVAIGVFNEEGKLLYASGEFPKEVDLTDDELRSVNQEAYISQELTGGTKRLNYLEELRVIGERYGFIQISYSLAEVEARQFQDFMAFGGLLASILLVMLVLLNVILFKTIIQPITSLRNAMQRIRSGELGNQVRVSTQDELGDLARTFNVMSLQLQQKQHEYEELNRIVKLQEEAKRRHEIAEAANQAKSEFLKVLSHEIRTPLNAILGFSELARQTPYAETLRVYIERIVASGKILNSLVNGVLDLAGIEAGKFTLHSDNFQLHSILHTAVKLFQFDTKEETVSWKIFIDPDIPPQLYGDSTRLTQVLVNLISNAVKFTQHGTISVLVTLEKTIPEFAKSLGGDGDRLWLHFSVEDTGIGIPDEEQDAIFQQFFQGENAMRYNFGGTGGIGMTIVRKIVETMQGDLWFNSQLGVGTQVHIVLPFHVAIEESPERAGVVSLASLRILVAEDNGSNRMMLQDWLLHLGFQVETAENGEVALERWKHGAFDVILMDKQMPGMDGLQATQHIRTLEKDRGTRTHIIALTAAATIDDREQCLQAGMDDYLPKPVAIAALLNKLNVLFSESGIGSEEKVEEEASSPFIIGDNESLFSLGEMPTAWRNDPSKTEKYIALMKSDIHRSLQRLEQAIGEGDPVALSKAAHKLKGAIGKLRSEAVQELTRHLEGLKRQGDIEEAAVLLKRLEKELDPLLEAAETSI